MDEKQVGCPCLANMAESLCEFRNNDGMEQALAVCIGTQYHERPDTLPG